MINWNLAARVTDQLESPVAGLIRGQAGHAVSPFYNGNHRATAFVLARGPALRGGQTLPGGHILDIAPTVLGLLGVDAPESFEGRAWNSFVGGARDQLIAPA